MSSFQHKLGGALRLDGQRQQLASRRGLGLRRHDVDRRHRAHLDPHPVVLHELLGQRQRLPLHAHGGALVDEVPVGQTDVGQRVARPAGRSPRQCRHGTLRGDRYFRQGEG